MLNGWVCFVFLCKGAGEQTQGLLHNKHANRHWALLHLGVGFVCLETGSHTAQAGFELTVYLKMENDWTPDTVSSSTPSTLRASLANWAAYLFFFFAKI